MNVRSLLPLFVVLLASCAHHSPQDAAPSTEACVRVTPEQIAALFDRWNKALSDEDMKAVLDRYAEGSVLLPTLKNGPLIKREDKEAYFQTFFEHRPVGTINWRWIDIDCRTAVDTGLYSFEYRAEHRTVLARYTYSYRFDGHDWFISSHHSSARPQQ